MTLWEVLLDIEVKGKDLDEPVDLKLRVVGDYDADSAVKAARDLVQSRGFDWPDAEEEVDGHEIETVSLRGVKKICIVHAISDDVLNRGADAFVRPDF